MSDGIIKGDWNKKECGCWKCITERDDTARMMRMVLCPTCGNKRCPHASNHDLVCTHSNAPGQSGSIYGRMDNVVEDKGDEKASEELPPTDGSKAV